MSSAKSFGGYLMEQATKSKKERSATMTAFEKWMKRVDSHMESICGLSSNDLEDYIYYDCFDADQTPKQTALEALEDAGFPMEEI